jgi:cobalt/nickel transport protein
VLFLTAASISRAHFSILLPSVAVVKRGEKFTLEYQWGHPFEHELYDAPRPEAVMVNAPLPAPRFLTSNLREGSVSIGTKKARVYGLDCTAEHRQDYVFVAQSPPIWTEADQVFYQDSTKVIVHVQGGKGWDDPFIEKLEFELVPLTRPYGLEPGMVFQARVFREQRPLANCLVEIEHYNSETPEKLPPDEQITRAAKTDPNGVVSATLTDSGWWCIAAQCDGGTTLHDGKLFPVRKRAILWVHVDRKESSKPK